MTKFRAATAPSLEKIRAMSTSPLARAFLESGPPESRGLKLLNFRPYVFSRPGWQKGRVGHSGGPPSVIPLATAGLRSDIVFKLYLSAVALVTAKALASMAADGLRTLMPLAL